MKSLSAIAAVLSVALASLANVSDLSATDSGKPASTIDRLYRVDCGHSLANDESVWTPGENKGKSIEFSSTCYLIQHRSGLFDVGHWRARVDDRRSERLVHSSQSHCLSP